MTARSSIECSLATVPLDEVLRAGEGAAGPLGRIAPSPAPLLTAPLPASFRPDSPLPWQPSQAPPASLATAPVLVATAPVPVATAPVPVATSPSPFAPVAPAAVTRPVVTRPIVIEVPCPPVRRAPRSDPTEGRASSAQALAPRPPAPVASWLAVAATAAFFGMVGALLMRGWLG
ncbi:hypothetical protein WME90_04855 [Sorangium sp. So ce375]|uniref:hypothetical protein n=1 Tax=Sorangium sp. So ce375 TaxID=3133306 RepID=UPI003F5C4E6C